MQLRTKTMDDIAEIGPANHLGYEKKQERERARRDVIPVGECIYFDEAYERGMKLQQLELSKLDVNLSLIHIFPVNDRCYGGWTFYFRKKGYFPEFQRIFEPENH